VLLQKFREQVFLVSVNAMIVLKNPTTHRECVVAFIAWAGLYFGAKPSALLPDFVRVVQLRGMDLTLMPIADLVRYIVHLEATIGFRDFVWLSLKEIWSLYVGGSPRESRQLFLEKSLPSLPLPIRQKVFTEHNLLIGVPGWAAHLATCSEDVLQYLANLWPNKSSVLYIFSEHAAQDAFHQKRRRLESDGKFVLSEVSVDELAACDELLNDENDPLFEITPGAVVGGVFSASEDAIDALALVNDGGALMAAIIDEAGGLCDLTTLTDTVNDTSSTLFDSIPGVGIFSASAAASGASALVADGALALAANALPAAAAAADDALPAAAAVNAPVGAAAGAQLSFLAYQAGIDAGLDDSPAAYVAIVQQANATKANLHLDRVHAAIEVAMKSPGKQPSTMLACTGWDEYVSGTGMAGLNLYARRTGDSMVYPMRRVTAGSTPYATVWLRGVN
jgi:hypothetical protein